MRQTWTFHCAGQIVFGRGAALQVGEAAQRLGARRALLVTDPNLVRAGLAEPIASQLRAAGIVQEAFHGGEPEPSFRAALACLDQAKHFRPDVLVGLGGGSNMDLAKLTGILLAHGGKPSDYAGDDKVPGPITPTICIPTTAGTGSEVSAAAVLTDTDNFIKIGILSNHLRPRVALVDPLMSATCPPRLSADSGIDALTHAIEAYTAVDNELFPLPPGEHTTYQGRNPMASGFAEHAIQLIGRALGRVVEHGDDLDAREAMALAALQAGLAFSNSGVALVHAMEYPVGGAVHCSHGTGNGLLLPHVMRYNLPARQRQFAEIAGLLGVEIHGLDEAVAAGLAIQAVDTIRARIGIPDRLRDLGVKEEQLPGFAEKACGIRRIVRVNPRVPTVEDVLAIYREAY